MKGSLRIGVNVNGGLLSDQALSFIAEGNVPRKDESVGPVHDLFIGVVRVVSTERGPTD